MADIIEFKKNLQLHKSDYIPMAELGIHPEIKSRYIGRQIISIEDEIEFWFKAGYDYVKLQPKADFNPAKIGISDEKSFKEDGTLSFNWATEGKGVISSFDDFEKYVFPNADDFDYSNFDKARKLLPDGLGIIGQYGDIFTMTWEMMGFEAFSFALFENPDLIKALNDKIGELVLSMFKYFAESDAVDVIWFSDDIAYTNGLLMSPEVLDEYFFPWLKKIGDMAKAAGKPLIYHTDGVLFDVFDKIIECGVDAIHPIEPKAMQIKDVKEKYGDKLCLIGHVDVDLLSRGSKEEVIKVIEKNIEQAWNSTGYCVGSGNSIPQYVKYENYLAMINFMKDLRK
jgi:uroporphyrinogen decarboxylase